MEFHALLTAVAAKTARVRETIDSPRKLEVFLHQCGFTKSQSRAITAGGWRGMQEAADHDEGQDTGQDVPDDALADWLRTAAAKHARQ